MSKTELIQSLYRAFGAGDAQTILDALADDVEWHTEGPADAAPWYGPLHGKDGVAGFFAAIGGATEVTEFDVVGIAETDTEVLSFIRYGFRKRGSDAPLTTMHLHHYFRFRDDGKIAYVRNSEDTALVAQVLAA
jgi:uncharacterized protein